MSMPVERSWVTHLSLPLAAVAVLLGPGVLSASDGLCPALCLRAFGQCLWDAGCRYRSCRDGSSCSASGRCADGTSCGMTGCGPEASACFSGRAECLRGCVDWLAALRQVEGLDIDEQVRAAMLEDLKLLESDIDGALRRIDEAVKKHLGSYRAHAEALHRTRQLDFATAWALQETARQAELQLSEDRLRSTLLAWPDPGPEAAAEACASKPF